MAMSQGAPSAPLDTRNAAAGEPAGRRMVCAACHASFGVVGLEGWSDADGGQLARLDPLFCPRCGRPFVDMGGRSEEEMSRQRAVRALKSMFDAEAPQGAWRLSQITQARQEGQGPARAVAVLVSFDPVAPAGAGQEGGTPCP